MRLSFTLVSVIGLLAVDACAETPPPLPVVNPAPKTPPGPIQHVVLVTLDGLLPDAYQHPDAHGLKVPTLRWLVAHGASSDGALSVFPSVTYPSHTSMLTGVSPGSHGIVSNRTFDPLDDDLEGWRWYAEDVKRDPVWRLVEQSGYHAALVGWPVTVGAKVTWLAPEYWRARNRNDPKLLRALSTPGLLEGVGKEHADFWTRLSPSDPKDDALTDIAIHVLANGRPNFLALHLVQVDGAQHHFGLWSPEAVAAIEDDDRQLARIFELLYSSGMARDTRVIVASDHGFMNAPTLVKPGVLLREAGLVRLDDKAHVVDWAATALVNGGQAYIYVKDAHDATTREALRKLFAAQVADPQGVVARVYEAADIAAIGGDPDAFLAIEARPGFQFGPGYGGALVGPAKYRATHGYDPRRPEMHASLLMFGPDIPHGTIEGARLVDVGPTVAAWLGIPMLGVEGHPLVVASAK